MDKRSFSQTDIRFSHRENRLAGSLSSPTSGGPFPAIIMLHGSGPADRNNGNYFPEIRDYLVSQGIAVLCYDKPGVGLSTGSWQQLSFEDRAEEALAAIDYLQPLPQIDPRRIGLRCRFFQKRTIEFRLVNHFSLRLTISKCWEAG